MCLLICGKSRWVIICCKDAFLDCPADWTRGSVYLMGKSFLYLPLLIGLSCVFVWFFINLRECLFFFFLQCSIFIIYTDQHRFEGDTNLFAHSCVICNISHSWSHFDKTWEASQLPLKLHWLALSRSPIRTQIKVPSFVTFQHGLVH